MHRNKSATAVPLLLLALTLAGCGEGAQQDTARDGTPAASLPAPESAGGSVTGMPDTPGTGEAALITGTPPPALEPLADPDAALANPESGLLPGSEATSADPDSLAAAEQDAIAVIRDYYAALNAGSHARAHSLWADGGRASGQTPEQFANAFGATEGITVQISPPGAMAGDGVVQTITVPVTASETRRDGSVRRYDGSFTLRRAATADGTAGDERAWRIAAADLREL